MKLEIKKYDTALVLGYGRSGRAAERLLQSEGTQVSVVADELDDSSKIKDRLKESVFDVCIISPGFPISHPWVRAVQESGISLLSELELGWSRHKAKTIAVTGSNGKSTAVKWINEMLTKGGFRTAIGGNYGVPVCEVVLDSPELDWLILEVSSFQLETILHFHAEVAVLLNVLPNHLDRHGSLENYRKIKARIFEKSTLNDNVCIVPADLLSDLKKDLTPTARSWVTFGTQPIADFWYRDGTIFCGKAPVLKLTGTLFDSPVMGSCTGAAVAAVAKVCSVSYKVLELAAQEFNPLPHRLQPLGEIDGVIYVNDSKATNLAAVAVGLESCKNGIHLIAGGVPKESDYNFIKEILAERVKSIYLVGQASRVMYQAWSNICSCVECGSLENAFRTARNTAKSGEVILLSPGCASFDQFLNFEERGERFIALFHDAIQSEGDV